MLAHTVAAQLRDAIAAGEFRPGDQLNEVRVAERFDCSRNTLREAFTQLAAQQLVERIPNRGVFIARPDVDFVRDLYIARAAIEPSAARWANYADAHELVTLAESAREFAAREEHHEVSSINQRFHRAIVAGLGSPSLDKQMSQLLARMRLSFLLILPHYPTLHVDHVEANVELARLIADGKREEAAVFCHDSLLETLATLEGFL